MSDSHNWEHVGADPLAAALEYAERGWRVLPLYEPDSKKPSGCTCPVRQCKSPGKHPRITKWGDRATTDRDQIEAWWGRWPTANIGIATGDGLAVVDVDPRNGGTESWAEVETEHGALLTWTVKTGSGGKHFYLSVNREVRCQNNWRRGIDIKGDGGYVVAPPSSHVGGSYRVLRKGGLMEAPQWLLESVEAGTRRSLTGRKMSASQLARLAAPGETPEERIKWTREAAACIPNDRAFDDRNAWVGMAHAIKVSCGADAEEEAFEIFDEFSQGWEGAPGYDPDKTRRAWQTLPPPTATKGYRKLVSLARRHGYDYPDDHPDSPQSEFDVDHSLVLPAVVGEAPAYIPSPFRALDEEWTWKDLLAAIPTAQALVREVPPSDARKLELIIVTKGAGVVRSWRAAQQIWRSYSPPPDRCVEVIDGKTVIRAADPTDLNLDADYLVEGLIPAAAVGEIIADYSMGKTWLLLALALSVAFGLRFFGRPTEQGAVLYLAYEGQRGLWKRAAGWLRAHDLVSEESTSEELRDVVDGRLIVAEIPPRFDQAQIESLIRDTVRHYGARLVIIDTRGKSLGAELDENSADSANLVQGVLSAIAQETGATVISAHHKPLSAANRGRGSSAWTQGADFAFTIDGTRDDFEDGKPVTLKTIKFRDDDAPKPLSLRLRAPIEVTVDGAVWRTGVIEPVSVVESRPLPPMARVFLTIEANAGCGKQQLRDGVEGGSTRIDLALKRLLEKGAVEDRGDRRRRRYHTVPGWRVENNGAVRHEGEDFDDEGVRAATVAVSGRDSPEHKALLPG